MSIYFQVAKGTVKGIALWTFYINMLSTFVARSYKQTESKLSFLRVCKNQFISEDLCNFSNLLSCYLYLASIFVIVSMTEKNASSPVDAMTLVFQFFSISRN